VDQSTEVVDDMRRFNIHVLYMPTLPYSNPVGICCHPVGDS